MKRRIIALWLALIASPLCAQVSRPVPTPVPAQPSSCPIGNLYQIAPGNSGAGNIYGNSGTGTTCALVATPGGSPGGPYLPLAGGPLTGATGGAPISGGINATQLEVNGVPVSGGAGGVSSSATIDAANSETQADSIVGSVLNGLNCFGDSITLGSFAPFSYCDQMGTDYNLPNGSINYAVSGDNVQDFAWHVFSALNPGDENNPTLTGMIGTNNISAQTGYAAAIAAAYSWGAMSSTNKILATNGSVAATGTFSTDTTFDNANGVTCTSGPCTLTYTGYVGPPAFFYVWFKTVSSGGNFSVTVDGSAVTDTISSSSTISTTWGTAPIHQSASVSMARFPASNASHSLVVTFQTGATILGFGFPPNTRYRGASHPRFLLGGVIPEQNNANQTITQQVNALNLAASKLLVSDGLDVPFVDVYNAVDPILDFTNTQNCSGTTGAPEHPGSCGQMHLTQVFESVINAAVLTGVGFTDGGSGSYTLTPHDSGGTVWTNGGTIVIPTSGLSSGFKVTIKNYSGSTAATISKSGISSGDVPASILPYNAITIGEYASDAWWLTSYNPPPVPVSQFGNVGGGTVTVSSNTGTMFTNTSVTSLIYPNPSTMNYPDGVYTFINDYNGAIPLTVTDGILMPSSIPAYSVFTAQVTSNGYWMATGLTSFNTAAQTITTPWCNGGSGAVSVGGTCGVTFFNASASLTFPSAASMTSNGLYTVINDYAAALPISVTGTSVLMPSSIPPYSSFTAQAVSNGYWMPVNVGLWSNKGTATLSLGTVTVSTPMACTPGTGCAYQLQNCGVNSSTAIGVSSVGTVTAGTSFVINSESAAAAVVTGDASTICWQVN